MIHHHRPTHFGQLLASALVFCCLTDAVVWSVRGVDRGAPNAAAAAGAALTLWLFSLVWAVIVAAFVVRGLVRAAKTPPLQRRPRRGSGSRPPSDVRPPERGDWAAERPYYVAADEWAAHDALAEARHARREAERAAA